MTQIEKTKKSTKGLNIYQTKSVYSNEWYTPNRVFEALNTSFNLDPCSPGDNHTNVPAALHYSLTPISDDYGQKTKVCDGLKEDWDGYVFMNPPYERGLIEKWISKFSEHGNGIACIFARTETKWWHDSIANKADCVLFIKGRIKFDNPSRDASHAQAPSVLVGFGEQAIKDLQKARDNGLGYLMLKDTTRK